MMDNCFAMYLLYYVKFKSLKAVDLQNDYHHINALVLCQENKFTNKQCNISKTVKNSTQQKVDKHNSTTVRNI